MYVSLQPDLQLSIFPRTISRDPLLLFNYLHVAYLGRESADNRTKCEEKNKKNNLKPAE